MLEFSDIKEAAERIQSGIIRSPCPPSVPLSIATGMEVYCKLEYLQRTGSFKERGARNALLQLPAEQRKIGVIAASAGNHALGLSYHAQLLGIPVTVIMPKTAPLIKITNCEQLGARVFLHGSNVDEAKEEARALMEKEGLAYVHGFDDPAVIAGQGTLGLEIIEQVPDLHAVIVPIGGAGLIAGMSLAIKSIRPEVRIIGVQPEQVASWDAAVRSGKPVTVPIKPTLADGLAVPRVGRMAYEIARRFVDHYVLVSEQEIARAVLRLVELEKAVVEGAGAVSLAACMGGLLPELAGKKVVLPLCGGNIDTTILGRVIERGLAADGRLCRFYAILNDHPGGLAHFTCAIAETGANIVDIAHDRAFSKADITHVAVQCVVETRDSRHIDRLRERLIEEGFSVEFPNVG